MVKNGLLTPGDWCQQLKGKPTTPETDQITLLLAKYHATAGTEVSARVAVLDEIESCCQSFLDSIPDPGYLNSLYAPTLATGMHAAKLKRTIGKASNNWSMLRKRFGPSGSALGNSRTIVNRTGVQATPSSEGNYWLETVDPKHRAWGHQGKVLFQQWLGSVTDLSFWDWLTENGNSDHLGVQYVAPDQRWRHWVCFEDNRTIAMHNPLGVLTPFDTKTMSTVFSGVGYAIWVCSPGGVFYSGNHVVNEFHHSSFLAGGRVLGAGEWLVRNGNLLWITHKTGHYQATPQNLFNCLVQIQKRTSIDKTLAKITNYVANTSVVVSATEFVRQGGDVSKCQPIPPRVPQPATSEDVTYGDYTYSAYVY